MKNEKWARSEARNRDHGTGAARSAAKG